jgi:argininosuccinate lyase
MKSWGKASKIVEGFTVGEDYLLDNELLKYDCKASIAHAKMLFKIGIITEAELQKLASALTCDSIEIAQADEDCHTAIENHLVKKLGELGGKLHTARSRNDQVLVALRLYEKHELAQIGGLVKAFIKELNKFEAKFGSIAFPGYTHMQKAMPTTVSVWIESFIASAHDNLKLLEFVEALIDQNPLGSAAGFGVPGIQVDKDYTTQLLGFKKPMPNPLYCQLSRGKFESTVLHALSQIMFDLNKFATDILVLSLEGLDYVKVSPILTTGSSIMPNKHNPDLFELLRANYSIVLAEEFKIKSLISSLMSGYNRDFQLTKAPLMKSIECTKKCIKIACFSVKHLQINEEGCRKALTEEMNATEEANKLAMKGMPFRKAYRKVKFS